MAEIRLIAQMRVAPGSADRFIAGWQEHLRDVAAEPGCLQYEMFRSVDDTDQIALLERWASQDDFDVHTARELAQPGGPGVSTVADLVVESNGALYHTEIYDRRRFGFDGTAWVEAQD